MKSLLERAITAMRNDSVDSSQVEEAANRVRERLEVEHNKVVVHPMATERISSCADFQSLIPAYLTKSLTEKRAFLFEDHTRECVGCRRALQDARSPRSSQRLIGFEKERRGVRKYAVAAIAATVVATLGMTQMSAIRDLLWPIEVTAVAQTIDGNLFLITGPDIKPVTAGQRIERDQVVRTGMDSGAILQLADGSKIEMRERSELSLGRGTNGVRIALDRGSVIVTAAQQHSGRLYVATEDCTVSVVGTVFSVNTGAKGSRVSVVEGEVHVEHGGASKALLPGEQLSTNPALGTVPVEQDIAWSRNAEVHRELLRELLSLKQDLTGRIAAQELRYSSNLLNVVPDNTIILAALPNLTSSFAEAYGTFRQRILENPALLVWWNEQLQRNQGFTFDDLVDRVSRVGSYLGPEILVVVPQARSGEDDPILIAEALQSDGLQATLHEISTNGLTIRVESGLFVASASKTEVDRIFALRRLAGPGPFTATTLYARVLNAYREGVGWLVAADVERILAGSSELQAAGQIGIQDAQQLLIEQKTGSSGVAFQATLGFNQARRGMVGWLAPPAPIGAVEFVSASAYGAAAVATKDPSQILEDIFSLLAATQPDVIEDINEMQQKHRIDLRRDLAEPLGAEFLFAIDGPVLPTPSWKAVVEVYDAARLQNTIQWLITEYNREAAVRQEPVLNLSSEMAGGRTYYAVVSSANASHQIHYTFWSGYLIAAPNRTLLAEAIQYKETSNSLARSPAFQSQIPPDGRDYISGFFYQNVASLVPSGTGIVNAIAPTLICLYGEPDRIVMSSKGVLGMNLASLAGLMEQVRSQ